MTAATQYAPSFWQQDAEARHVAACLAMRYAENRARHIRENGPLDCVAQECEARIISLAHALTTPTN